MLRAFWVREQRFTGLPVRERFASGFPHGASGDEKGIEFADVCLDRICVELACEVPFVGEAQGSMKFA